MVTTTKSRMRIPGISVLRKFKMELEVNRERILITTSKNNASPAVSTDRHERKALQTLQLSAAGNKLNGGKVWAVQQKDTIEGKDKAADHEESPVMKTPHSPLQIVKIYEDSSLSANIPTTHCSQSTQTNEDLVQEKLQHDVDDSGRDSGYIDQEEYDYMVKEEPSETYWKELAEERRIALIETLADNERLLSKIDHLNEKMAMLQQQNVQLKDIATKAEAFAEFVAGVLSDDEDTATGKDGSEDDNTEDVLETGPVTSRDIQNPGAELDAEEYEQNNNLVTDIAETDQKDTTV